MVMLDEVTRRDVLKARLDANRSAILDHVAADPANFDGREHLYMEYHFLLREYEAS